MGEQGGNDRFKSSIFPISTAEPPRPGEVLKSDWEVGDQILGRFQIYEIVEGGMGILYFCYDHQTKEPVVVKTYKRDEKNDYLLARLFEAEAMSWIRLGSHPHIVQAKYVIHIANKPYLFMEYVPGPDGMMLLQAG